MNQGDFLTDQALYLVHDYLHCFAAAAINDAAPELRFSYGEITRATLEQYAFCHLLTEAAAVIGLDYWYLCVRDLDEVCGNGTSHGPLTVSYAERDAAEYRRFCPDLVVQAPEFLSRLTRFYCSGELEGLSINDVRRSAKLEHWLSHELRYGVLQRRYIREWLAYLSNGRVSLSPSELEAPVEAGRPWQRKLMERVALLLWRKVKLDEMHQFKSVVAREKVWRRSPSLPKDLRFTNLASVADDHSDEMSSVVKYPDWVAFYNAQFISQYRYAAFSADFRRAVKAVQKASDVGALRGLFEKASRAKISDKSEPPSDIFFPG